MCHALPREHRGSPSPEPCQPLGCTSSTHTPPHAGPGPRDCPAPFASCLHLPGGAPVGPHHAESPLRGDKSPLLASPLPAAPWAVNAHTKCIFVLFDGKGIFSHCLAVSIETPESGVGHLPTARSTRSTCACGCAGPGGHTRYGQRPPAWGADVGEPLPARSGTSTFTMGDGRAGARNRRSFIVSMATPILGEEPEYYYNHPRRGGKGRRNPGFA